MIAKLDPGDASHHFPVPPDRGTESVSSSADGQYRMIRELLG
jgi:hypothetical protein